MRPDYGTDGRPPNDPPEGCAAGVIAAISGLIVAVLLAWLIAKALLSFADAWRTADQFASCSAVCVEHLLKD